MEWTSSNRRVIVILLVVTITTPGCLKDKGAIKEELQPLPDSVYFSKHIQPLFNTYCTISGCHSGLDPAAKLDLSNGVAYQQLFKKKEVDTVEVPLSVLYIQMVSQSNPMPPSGRLGDYDIGLVLKWIQQKAKNN